MTLMIREAVDDLTEPSLQGDPDNRQSSRVWSRSSIGDKARSQTTCSQFHQSRLVELSNPSTSQYHDTLKQVMDYFAAHGSSLAQAQQQAFAWIGQQVQVQAAYLAYIDVFWTLTIVSLAAVPLALTLRKVKLGGPAPVSH